MQIRSAANLKLRLAVSVFASALVTSAFVVAQVPGTETLPVGNPTEKTIQKKVAKAPDKNEGGGQDVKAKAPVVKRPRRAAQGKKEIEDAAAANRLRVIEQYTSIGMPYVRAEVIFVRHVCPLSREKLREISRDADRALSDVVTRMADSRRQGTIAIKKSAKAARYVDGTNLLQDALRAVMKKHLTPEQWSIYQTEADKRLASRIPIAVRYLVEALDRDLYLSDQQRARLTESLTAHWDDGWDIYLGYMARGNHSYPMTIDPLVSPVLSVMQKTVWQGCPRTHLAGIFGGNPVGFAQDDDALEEELGVARKAEPPNREMQRQLMIEARMLDLETVRAAEVRQLLEVRDARLRKIETKKAETKKPGAN